MSAPPAIRDAPAKRDGCAKRVQAAQGLEDRLVVFVVRAELNAVCLRDRQSKFEDVDRIKTEPIGKQGGVRIDRVRRDVQIERPHDKLSQFGFLGCLGNHIRHCLFHWHLRSGRASLLLYHGSWLAMIQAHLGKHHAVLTGACWLCRCCERAASAAPWFVMFENAQTPFR